MVIATKTIPVALGKRLNIDQFPNAGPHPSITGMKKLYWGMDAYCVKCGVYVYKVTKKFYDRV